MSAAQQEQSSIVAKRVRAFCRADPHAVHLDSVLQLQNAGSLLMHPGKLQAREIDKGVVTGENTVLCTNLPACRYDPILLNANRRILMNGQQMCDMLQKAHGMELCLPGKTNDPGG